MKTLITILISFALVTASKAQFEILNKVKEKVEEKTEEKVEEEIEEAFEKKEESGEKEEQKENENRQNKADDETVVTDPKKDLKHYSKYDFVPGEQIIFLDDFSQDNVGDFPMLWNTNSGGEIVTLNNYPGHWFRIQPGGTVYPEWDVISLPENFTFEMDLIPAYGPESMIPFVCLSFYEHIEGEDMDGLVPGNGGFQIDIGEFQVKAFNWSAEQTSTINQAVDREILSVNNGNLIHVAVSVQKQRVRVYINETKVFDLPRLLFKDIKLNRFRFFQWDQDGYDFNFYVGNIRFAQGLPDTRTKILEQGGFVTTGIKFDSGSDIIKPESYAVLKEIADVLKQEAAVNLLIVGHTDSDGSEGSNLELSEKRSASVKNALVSEFGIEENRLTTSGKGESEPVDDNSTLTGKANNRRVEFIKQ